MSVYGRHKITVNVIGVNGMKFCISGDKAGDMGIWLMDEHVGLLDTPVETIWSSSAAQVGATFNALRFQAREVTLPVVILDSPSRPWQMADSLWRKAWSYTEDAQIEIISSSGRRVLNCRLSATPEFELGKGGQFKGSARMLMHLKAGDPMWYDEDVTDVWRFDGIRWDGTVTVTNPTDQPMWLRWTLTGPASMILPDFSWETREGYPGFEHQRRLITLPFQPYGVDVAVDTDPEVEQIVSLQRPAWGAKMNGQFFCYPVPPWTTETELPVFVNPLPWTNDVWRALQIPFAIPTEALAKTAEILTKIMTPLDIGEPGMLGIDQLAEFVDQALQEMFQFFRDKDEDGDGQTDAYAWVEDASKALTKNTIGQLFEKSVGYTAGQVFTLPGAAVQVRQVRRWSRPYGLE